MHHALLHHGLSAWRIVILVIVAMVLFGWSDGKWPGSHT